MKLEEKKFGKQRNPLAVALLSFITLGIYFIYWYYKVNEEIRAYDPRIEVEPGISAIAIALNYLFATVVAFVIGLVSAFNTGVRARVMFSDYNSSAMISPLLAALLYAFGGLGFPMLALFYPAYVQSQLNYFWREQAQAVLEEERKAA